MTQSADSENITREDWSGTMYGVCPVQADGLINSKVWYFKARGEHWNFEVVGSGFKIREKWGEWPEAGYISYAEAWMLIETALDKFRLEK